VCGLRDVQLRLVVQVGSWLLRSVGGVERHRESTIMTTATWMEMPVLQSVTSGGVARPRYAVEGNALLVYRGDKVFVATKEETVTADLMQKEGVRTLTQGEVQAIEATLPGVGASRLDGLGADRTDVAVKRNVLLLGDLISWLTSKLGIPECSACSRRKQRLNRYAVWRTAWWATPRRG
jgi:hypothetical protein